MNSIFKELLESGRIDPEPIFECTSDGVTRKAYQFSNNGAGMSQSRFESLGEVMRAYDAFSLDTDDVDLHIGLVLNNLKRSITDYKQDVNSAVELISQVIRNTEELKARREFGVPLTQLYDFLSFCAFEEDENPLIYDEKYNKEKIKRWRKDLEVEKKRPFLAISYPLLPDFSKLLEPDFLKYMQVQMLLNATTLRTIWEKSDGNGLSTEMRHIFESRMETLESSINFCTELSRITTDTLINGL